MTDTRRNMTFEELDADVQRAQEEIVGPVPTIAPAPDCVITLPRGLPHNGTMQTKAEVRELNGNDEEALARYRKTEDIFDAVIALGTERVGDLDLSNLPLADRQAHLRQLLVGERDWLFLTVARATYGDDRTYPYTCQDCKKEQDLTVKISEDFVPAINKEASNFTYTTSKGVELEVRLPVGADQLEVLKKEGTSSAEANTKLLALCVLSVNGAVVVDPLNFARGLPMRDRQDLITKMLDRQPTVDLVVKFECMGCAEEQQVTFGWLDFFRPQ